MSATTVTVMIITTIIMIIIMVIVIVIAITVCVSIAMIIIITVRVSMEANLPGDWLRLQRFASIGEGLALSQSQQFLDLSMGN